MYKVYSQNLGQVDQYPHLQFEHSGVTSPQRHGVMYGAIDKVLLISSHRSRDP